ncbi:response regulator transcription factor [Pedobacter frigiditerrae]|uniref:response regulator transcription factor n=1 Tax=Pedobacter frigiditerrae TaxID=2530452 RepID=UPI00292CDA86|nr:response regulator [Pedobacter frigiditerrae]
MKKCIYILEDNDDIRELISFLLTEENYDVKSYPTVKSFQNKMLYSHPDMVILDVMLTDGNGIDVCDELKGNTRTNDIPILMMSAHSHGHDIKQKCDVDDFISKPFDIDDFVKRVGTYLH